MIELLGIFVNNIAPILVIAGVGYFAGIRLQIDPRPFGRLLFYVLSPALVFNALLHTEITGSELWLLIGVMGLFVLLMALIAYSVMRLRGSERIERAGVMLSAACPNSGNFGLPIISFAFAPEVFARAVIVYIAVTIFNYSLGVYIASNGHGSTRDALWSIARVPAFYSALIGLLFNRIGIMLPDPLDRSLSLLSQATIPIMLIMLGLQLAQSTRLGHRQVVGIGVGLRLLIAPLVATALVIGLNIGYPANIAVIMQASMPVAVLTIIFASEFKLNIEQISGTVVVSTLLSPVTLSVLILVLQQAAQAASSP